VNQEAYIYAAIRTPRGKGRANGALHGVTPIQLLQTLLKTLRQRCLPETALVDDLMVGCVTPVGEQGANLARTALLAAGWDEGVPGIQVNRFCASGLDGQLGSGEGARRVGRSDSSRRRRIDVTGADWRRWRRTNG